MRIISYNVNGIRAALKKCAPANTTDCYSCTAIICYVTAAGGCGISYGCCCGCGKCWYA